MIKHASLIVTLLTIVLVLPLAAHAKDHTHSTKPTSLYDPAMAHMHKAMMTVHPTGNADVDFVKGMIPHHQGAIEMASILLKNGKDPEIRKLAENIIEAQKSEIQMMEDWLKQHTSKPE